MSTVLSTEMLVNGLRTEFVDTYSKIQNRRADSRLGLLMDTIPSTNYYATFAYFNAAPHMSYWRRGEPVPQDAFDSVSFEVFAYEYAKRVAWSKFDRKDDQTQSLMQVARMAGQSAALLEEEFFFELITGTASKLPAVPNAPDGVAMFSTTDGSGAARFGATSGNLLSGNGITTVADIRTDYYASIEQFKAFQNGKGQPLLSDDITDGGVVIVHAAADTEAFEEAFLQQRQAVLGPDNTTDAVTSVAVSNLVQDASRNVVLWGTPRLATGDWYVFLRNAPIKPTFTLDREGVQEFSSLEGDNNGDHLRNTGEEYIQWERRVGAGIALPYAAVKVNN